MAGIDRIYVTSYKDFCKFYDWCDKFKDFCYKETQLNILDYFYYNKEEFLEYFGNGSYVFGKPATNFSHSIDMWLIKHCPINWVRDRLLNIQYKSLRVSKNDIDLYLDYGRENK